MSVTNMGKLSWTAHTEYLLLEIQQHIRNHTRVTMPDQDEGITMKIEADKAIADYSLILGDITPSVIAIHIGSTLDCNIGIDAATTGAVHYNLTQPTEDTATDLAMTHHISHMTSHPNIKALQVIDPKTAVDHIHNHPTDLQDMNLTE